MQVKRRWMKWILQEADKFDMTLPWERGAKRSAWRRHLSSSKIVKLPRRA